MDRKVILLCVGAIPLGLAGGYAWSAMTAPPPQAYVPPKATIADVPASPEEYPAALDEDWSARGDDGCNAVRAAGKAPLDAGQPGDREEMDGDADGIACEPIRRR